MSLSFDEMAEALRSGRVMAKRLTRLIGFDPSTSNHYGIRQLYNHRIDEKTTDEQILRLRRDYLKWRGEVIAFFEDNSHPIDDDELGSLFSQSFMYGTVYFLGIPLDIYAGIEPYRKKITERINNVTEYERNTKNG